MLLLAERWAVREALLTGNFCWNSGGKKRGFMTFLRKDRQLRKSKRMSLGHVKRKLESKKFKPNLSTAVKEN